MMSVSTQHAPRDARETLGMAGGIAALAEGKLYALQHPYALDGRVSSYPASARGFSVANSYLLTQSDAAMLIDTGFGKDEPAIRAQIEQLIAPGLPLSLFPLRLNEFMSINNVETVRRALQRRAMLHQQSRRGAVVRFRRQGERPQHPGFDAGHRGDAGGHDPARQARTGQIDVMQAPIRLIATRWLYDRATRTLFSSDLFTHVWRARADGPWIVTDDDDTTTERELRSFMLNTRYWWLEGAPTDSIRRGIAEVFDKYDVETIAPGYGCVLRGRKVVARHVAMLDEILKGLDKSVAVSRYVVRDEER